MESGVNNRNLELEVTNIDFTCAEEAINVDDTPGRVDKT